MRSPWETATTKDHGGLATVVLRLRQGRWARRACSARQPRLWAAVLSVVSFYWLTPSSAHAQPPPAVPAVVPSEVPAVVPSEVPVVVPSEVPVVVPSEVAPGWQLHFTAPSACATEETFRKALDERALRPEALPRARNHRIVVSILPAETGWTGRLVVESTADGVRVERTARATHCEELVPALALMTALVLDLEPSATPEPPSSRPLLHVGSLSSSPLVPARPKLSRRPPVPPAVPPRAVSRLTEGELGFLVHWRSVVGWRDRVAVAPSLLWGSRAGQGFSPWVRVSAAYVATQILDASGFGASLTWTIAQLDACTHKRALWGGAFVSPCARLSMGALHAEGRAGVHTPHDPTRLWLTAGGGAEVAIPIVGPLWLRVQGGLEALVLRQRVYVDGEPDHTLVQMPPGLALVGVGLGVRIW